MPFQAPITIATARERMHRHDYVLPAIQREFVWGTDRICKLFDSLMRGYPFGSFLFWQVSADSVRSFTRTAAPDSVEHRASRVSCRKAAVQAR